MPPRSLSHLLGKKSPADCAAGRKCAGSTYQSSQCIIILKTLTTAKTFFNLILYHHTLLFFIYLPTYHLNRPARSSRHWSTSSPRVCVLRVACCVSQATSSTKLLYKEERRKSSSFDGFESCLACLGETRFEPISRILGRSWTGARGGRNPRTDGRMPLPLRSVSPSLAQTRQPAPSSRPLSPDF